MEMIIEKLAPNLINMFEEEKKNLIFIKDPSRGYLI